MSTTGSAGLELAAGKDGKAVASQNGLYEVRSAMFIAKTASVTATWILHPFLMQREGHDSWGNAGGGMAPLPPHPRLHHRQHWGRAAALQRRPAQVQLPPRAHACGWGAPGTRLFPCHMDALEGMAHMPDPSAVCWLSLNHAEQTMQLF